MFISVIFVFICYILLFLFFVNKFVIFFVCGSFLFVNKNHSGVSKMSKTSVGGTFC